MHDPLPKHGREALLPIDSIAVEHDYQSREGTSPATREEYADLYRDGERAPKLVVYDVGGRKVLVAGFHRILSARDAGIRTLECWVVPGTESEARLYAAGTNRRHGLPRTPGDKRRAVHMVLSDPAGKDWPVERVALHCGVSLGLVKAMKADAWEEPTGLFGPTGEEPPAPSREEDLDEARLRERMMRSGRKFVRYVVESGLDPKEVCEWVLKDMEEKAEVAKRRGRPAKEPAGVEEEEVANVQGGE